MRTKIYLAGGFKGGWHENVIELLGDQFVFFNPKNHALSEPEKYTTWDLYHVDKCDILFGYMAEDNPSGYGLALEIGYAKAKGKLIILIDERSSIDEKFHRYFSICHESSNIVCSSIEEAVEYLKTF